MALGAGLVAFGLFFLLFLAVSLVVEIFFLLNLMETLRRVSVENRRMTPGLVWLIIIPVFGSAWLIYSVLRITDSLRAEYRSRGWQPDGDFGYGVGLAAGILSVASLVWGWIPGHVAAIGGLISLGYLVCWIIYWVRTARMKNRLGPARLWAGSAGPYVGYGPPPDATGGQGWAPPYAGGAGPGVAPGAQPGGWGTPPPAAEEPPAAEPPAEEPPAEEQGSSGDAADQSGYASDSAAGGASGDASGGAAGGSANQAKRCVACGTAVTTDDKFCRGCGSSL